MYTTSVDIACRFREMSLSDLNSLRRMHAALIRSWWLNRSGVTFAALTAVYSI